MPSDSNRKTDCFYTYLLMRWNQLYNKSCGIVNLFLSPWKWKRHSKNMIQFCVLKSTFSKFQIREDLKSQSLISKLLMSSFSFYLTVFGNCLTLLGYLIAQSNTDDRPCLSANILILLGHFLTMISDAFTLIEDVIFIKRNRRDFKVNRFFFVANILSFIGQYKELKSSLWND